MMDTLERILFVLVICGGFLLLLKATFNALSSILESICGFHIRYMDNKREQRESIHSKKFPPLRLVK